MKQFVIGLIIGIVVMYFLNELKNKCTSGDINDIAGGDMVGDVGDVGGDLKNIFKKLLRQSARWSTASVQDKNAMIAVLHANYGAGYLWALRDIATNDQIKKATGIDILTFENEIVKIQDKATKNMIKICPDFGPNPSYLTSIGGEGT
jgi:hypothetical protein